MSKTKIILILSLFFSLACKQERTENKASTSSNSAASQIENKPAENSGKTEREEPLPLKYTACGCGCCGGVKPIKKCLYRSKGDDLRKIIEANRKAAGQKQCDRVGCSAGVEYKYCD